MGLYVNIVLTIFFFMDPGSHVEFQISTKNTNLVEDHPMNMCGKIGSKSSLMKPVSQFKANIA
jgi:hypothetical protein